MILKNPSEKVSFLKMNANNSWPPDPRASSLQPSMHRDTVLMAQVSLYREHAYKLCFTELFLNTMSLEYTTRKESGVVRRVCFGNSVGSVRLGFRSRLAKFKVPRAPRVIRFSLHVLCIASVKFIFP